MDLIMQSFIELFELFINDVIGDYDLTVLHFLQIFMFYHEYHFLLKSDKDRNYLHLI